MNMKNTENRYILYADVPAGIIRAIPEKESLEIGKGTWADSLGCNERFHGICESLEEAQLAMSEFRKECEANAR
jgi:hypothetical protein